MFLAMKFFTLCFFLAIILLQGLVPVNAKVRRYRFELVNSSHTRLCTTKTMLTINGQFPGPTIYARRGDLVIVDVINRADENITIHWHGVKMPRYPWTDGTNFVTQCPITPGTRFTQEMILSDEEGTLWWHAHSDWSRATVHGAIIILPPKGKAYPFPKPHAEVPFLLGEWWNGDMMKIMEGFYAEGRDSNLSDAFLINGQPGVLYKCSERDTYKLSVELGKTYLIRMVNAAMNYIIYFKIAGHSFTVVGADGAYTKPMASDYIAVAPGQTIDFLLEANQPPGHYYMVGRVYATGSDYIPLTGIVEYAGNYPPPASPEHPHFREFPTLEDSSDYANQFTMSLRSLADADVPKDVDHTMFYVVAINEYPCIGSRCKEPQRLLASMNNVSMLLPDDTDLLHAYYRGISGVYTTDFPDFPPRVYNYTGGVALTGHSRPAFGTAVRILEYNTAVEIVFQATTLYKIDHPMHLHGHNFYVVGSGLGNFDAAKDPAGYNLVDPPLMNTVNVQRNGWAAIRFRANNPGVWYMHCHFDRHQSWGMNMAFIVKDGKAPYEKMLPPPPDMPRCGGEPALDPLLISELGRIGNQVQ